MERKIGCNLLYDIKERKSGAKPERVRKSKRFHCIIKKCIRMSVGFPAVSRLDGVRSLSPSRLLWFCDIKEAERGREAQRRNRENKSSSGIKRTQLQRKPQSLRV